MKNEKFIDTGIFYKKGTLPIWESALYLLIQNYYLITSTQQLHDG